MVSSLSDEDDAHGRQQGDSDAVPDKVTPMTIPGEECLEEGLELSPPNDVDVAVVDVLHLHHEVDGTSSHEETQEVVDIRLLPKHENNDVTVDHRDTSSSGEDNHAEHENEDDKVDLSNTP